MPLLFRYIALFLITAVGLSSCAIASDAVREPTPTQVAQAQQPTAVSTPLQTTVTAVSTPYTPPPTRTPSLTPSATPFPTTAAPTNTPAPTATPTHTVTPIPTYDSASSEPTWGILFSGYSCSSVSKCENDTVAQEEPPQSYFMLSNGRFLTRLEESTLVPKDIYRIWQVSFSQDQNYMAYGSVVNGQWNVVVTNVENPEDKLLISPPSDFKHFEIALDAQCVLFFREGVSQNDIELEKRCGNNRSVEIIDTAHFEEMVLVSRLNFRLSPQRDKFLAYGRDRDQSVHLYVKSIGDASPPKLIYHSTSPCSDGQYNYAADVHWHPDGEIIEFLASGQCDGDAIDIFYTINASGENLLTKFVMLSKTENEYTTSIRLGDWSGDGTHFFYAPPEGVDPESSGIYSLNLETGNIQMLLSQFYIISLKIWRQNIGTNVQQN